MKLLIDVMIMRWWTEKTPHLSFSGISLLIIIQVVGKNFEAITSDEED
jgi:hypothetical protein